MLGAGPFAGTVDGHTNTYAGLLRPGPAAAILARIRVLVTTSLLYLSSPFHRAPSMLYHSTCLRAIAVTRDPKNEPLSMCRPRGRGAVSAACRR